MFDLGKGEQVWCFSFPNPFLSWNSIGKMTNIGWYIRWYIGLTVRLYKCTKWYDPFFVISLRLTPKKDMSGDNIDHIMGYLE